MDNSLSLMAQGPGNGSFVIPVHLAHLGSGEEHVARLVDLRRFGLFRRWDDLLDEGVAAVFGIMDGEAELVSLCFHASEFTPGNAATWLGDRGFKPLLFVPHLHANQKGSRTMRKKTPPLAHHSATKPTSMAKPAAASVSGDSTPYGKAVFEESIRLNAYQRWEAAGNPGGDGVSFWVEAEQELLQAK
jgi:hypothetical protein